MDRTELKTIASISLVVLAAVLVGLAGTGSAASGGQSSGIVIDFDDMDVTWTDVDLDDHPDSLSALEYACQYNGFSCTVTEEGEVTEINGVSSGGGCSWELWVVETGSTVWTKASGPEVDVGDYTVVSWAYRGEGELPTVGVDYTGSSIYGYPQAYRVVTLAPSVTETVCSLGSSNTIVGTDLYSNYPDSIAERKASGDISVVGGYTNPSYEMVVKCDPDIVICYGGQASHVQLAEKLRGAGIDAVVLYDGEDLQTIYENIFISGAVIGYDMAASVTMGELESAVSDVVSVLDSNTSMTYTSVMLALSTVKSPWVSGTYTYADDVAALVYGSNVYGGENGWVQVNSETIASSNPSVVIVMNTDYSATQEQYDTLMDSLSAEWKSTDAFKNGNIYLYCGELGDLSQRPGPRVAQLTEMIARTLHGDAFGDDIVIPKFLGDDYEDYLTYTKLLDYNE